jgi:methionyl aminopeptidase
MVLQLKTSDEIAVMREAGRIVAKAHIAMKEALRPGISTGELDKIAETVIRDHGAIPAFLNYPKQGAPNYPGTINASINDELVHGLPNNKRIIKEGDIVSLDTGCVYQGFVGDCAYTYAVGEIPASVQRLLDVTEESLRRGIEASVLPNTIKDVALTVQHYVESQGYSVAREYTGHGVGRSMHEDPEVPNWWSRIAERRGRKNQPLQVGMTYAIEPMVIAGRSDLMELEDHWTVVTKDHSLCAHFEHTIAITDGKPIILTLP